MATDIQLVQGEVSPDIAPDSALAFDKPVESLLLGFINALLQEQMDNSEEKAGHA